MLKICIISDRLRVIKSKTLSWELRGAGDKRGGNPGEYGVGEVLEAGILSRWKAGERGRKYATMQNISQSKKGYKGEAMETGRYPGRKGTKGERFVPPQGQYAHAHVSRSLGRTSPVTFLSVINVEREERALGSRIDQWGLSTVKFTRSLHSYIASCWYHDRSRNLWVLGLSELKL